MAGIGDMLDALAKQLDRPGAWLSEHPGTEEILGALPAIAGAYLLSRPYNSRVGTPLGAALATGGGLIAARGVQDQNILRKRQDDAATQTKQVEALKSAFPATGPTAPMNEALPTLVGAGFTPSESIDLAKQFEPQKAKSGKYWYTPKAGGGGYEGPTFFGEGEPVPAGSVEKPPTESATQLTNVYVQAAGELGLPTDPSKWTQQDRVAIRQRVTANKLAQQKLPQVTETPLSPKDFVSGPGGKVGFWTRDKSGKATFQPVAGAEVQKPKPIIRSVGGSLLRIDPDTFNVLGKIDAPAKVKDKNEWGAFADGYVKEHPDANGEEISTAYEKMKKSFGSQNELTKYQAAHPDMSIDDAIKNVATLKRKPEGAKPPALPTELKSIYSIAPASTPGAWVLTPAPNAIYPASGVLGTTLGGKKAPPLLYIPGKGFVAPGRPIPGTKIIWDGNP